MADQQDDQTKDQAKQTPKPSPAPQTSGVTGGGQVSSAGGTTGMGGTGGGATAPPAPPSPTDQIVNAAIIQIETAANTGRQQLSWVSINGWKNYLPGIDRAASDAVDNLLNTTLRGKDDTVKNAILEVVKDRKGKIPLSTGITDQIIGICQSLLSFGAGGLALSLAFIDKASKLSVPVQKYLAIAGIFYVELVIVSVLTLILYMLQARFRFPFLYFSKIGNAWPWFYYASINPDVPRDAVQFARKRLKANELYAQDFIKFTRRVLEEDYAQRLRSEIQQYFLLVSYQGYINQFSLRLANLFMYGFVGAFIAALLMLLLVSFFGL